MILLVPLGLIVAGVALQIATSLVYGVRGPAPGDSTYSALRIVSWVGIVVGLLIWTVIPWAALPICLLLWVIIGFAVVDTIRSSREMHRRTNAKLLAIAEREGQLANAGELLREMRSGWFVGEAASGLSHDLARGTPLYESVARHRGALPRIAPAYAAVGTLAHAEPQALDEASRPDDPALASAWRNWGDYLAYGVAMALAMSILLTFFLLFIIPQFHQIFIEFDLELPSMTRLLMSLARLGIGVWWLVILLLLGLLLGLFALGIMYLFDLQFLIGLTDRVFRRGHLAHVLRMVAMGVEHRVELPRLFYALSVTYPVASVRSRLTGCYTDAEIGRSLPGIMEVHDLVTHSERGLVETAMKVGNLPWALRQIAARKESQMAARMTVASRVAYPLIVLGIGLIVAFTVISLFVPIVDLVRALS
jgi:type II secretory pathway component PulF